MLARRIDRCNDLEALCIGCFAILIKELLTNHFGNVGRVHLDVAIMARRTHRFSVGERKLLLGNHSLSHHVFKARSPAFDRTAWIAEWVASRRAGQQRHHHRSLCEGKLGRVFAVVHECGGADAISARAKINGVEVESEDLFFGEFALNL